MKKTDIFARKSRKTSRATASGSANWAGFTSLTANALESLRTRGAGRTASTTRTDRSNLGLKERERIWTWAFLRSALSCRQLLQERRHIGRWSRRARVAGNAGISGCSRFTSFSRATRSTNFTLWSL